MPASGKQIEANRANAAKSTGPRTPRGKAKSSLNAVTHGLTAQSSVLPGEDPDQLEALSNSLMRQLKPRGMVQRLMAERVVSLAWKLRRAARAEEAIAREMEEGAVRSWEHERAMNVATDGKLFAGLGPPPRRRTAGALLADSFGARDGRLVRLTEYELKLDAALRAGTRELLKLQKEAEAFEEVEEEAEAPAEVAAPAPEERHRPEDPGLRRAAPAVGGDAPANETPVEKTNPIPTAARPPQVDASTGVAMESSVTAPGTFSSPPPGPRR